MEQYQSCQRYTKQRDPNNNNNNINKHNNNSNNNNNHYNKMTLCGTLQDRIRND